MQNALLTTVSLIMGGLVLALAGLVFKLRQIIKVRQLDTVKEREETQRRIYELAILKEIGERAGYSLNVEEILQIITGSLRQFIDYSAVSYIVISPEKLKLNTHLEESVDKTFLSEMKERMLASLTAILDKPIAKDSIDEIVSGAISINDVPQTIGSFFNIPLVIGGNLTGLLTIANVKKGLYKEADMTILYKITAQASEAVSRLQDVVKIEQRKLNAMVESMGEGVLMVDREYRITVANPKVKEIISYSKPQDITVFDFIESLGGKFDIRGRLEEAIIKGNFYISERTEIAGSFFEIGVYPVRHKSEKEGEMNFGAVVVFHDISKEYELEKMREDFTSMIVHELRSPLDGMKKIIELIVAGTIKKSSPQFKEYIGMVHQSSTSMLELVNDILDFSKLQAGKFEIRKEQASMKETVEDRVLFYKALSMTKGIKLTSYIDKNIPELSFFDPHAIKQVLNNFISNSLKYTPHGGHVEVACTIFDPSNKSENFVDKAGAEINSLAVPLLPMDIKLDKKSLVVGVFDNGVGIPADKIKELFTTYKQVANSPFDSEARGTGLGLVIAEGIVRAHEGYIGVKSVEKLGSTFFFAIPIEG